MHPREYTWQEAMDPLARFLQKKLENDNRLVEACRTVEMIVEKHDGDLELIARQLFGAEEVTPEQVDMVVDLMDATEEFVRNRKVLNTSKLRMIAASQ